MKKKKKLLNLSKQYYYTSNICTERCITPEYFLNNRKTSAALAAHLREIADEEGTYAVSAESKT